MKRLNQVAHCSAVALLLLAGFGCADSAPSEDPDSTNDTSEASAAPNERGSAGASEATHKGANAFYVYGGAIPANHKTWSGGSLKSALSGLAAGDTLVLASNSVVTEDIDVKLAAGAKVYAAPGYHPTLDGTLRLRCLGTTVAKQCVVYGLNVVWTHPTDSAHMVSLDGGSIDFGYSEVAIKASKGCYALIRPGQTLVNSRIHHVWAHDNPGVSSHDGNQDHIVYADPTSDAADIRIDHSLLEGAPRGRDVKIGGPSSGRSFGGITIDHDTLRTGHGPSNGQVSNGAKDTKWSYNLLIDSGASTNLTTGSGAGGGNTYDHNRSDKKTGPNDSDFRDGGGDQTLPVAELEDYEQQGAQGFGHLAP